MLSLIGLPGSGKSTVGRQLARRLSAEFIDTDAVIEERLGCSIREFFEREGEGSFRDVEQQVISDLVSGSRASDAVPTDTHPQPQMIVLSTGGGTVLREVNRDLLNKHTRVVYLRASPEDLFKRLRHDQNRPLLQGVDPLTRLRDLYSVRDPLYRQTAHFHIETGRPSVATLVNMVMMQLDLGGDLPQR